VSGCPTHGELLGGYLLGALEPAEMEAMRVHIESCPECARERKDLYAMPALLDRIEPGDVPPPELPPEVEDAVLDRYVRERGPVRRRRLAGPRLRVAAAAAGVALAAIVALVALLAGDGGQRAYAYAKLDGRGAEAAAEAGASVQAVPAGTRVSLWARRLQGGREAVYELWCVRPDGRWLSGGTFRARSDGSAAAELTAAVRPGDYHRIVVTRRPATAGERARGPTVMRGQLRY
jgi:Anti-sigma-K factor rskA/Putative zinc-finger